MRDLNNDTYFELAVGAPGTEGGGSIMLLHMEDEGMVGNYTMLNASTLDFRYLAGTWDERERCAPTRLPRRSLPCSLALLLSCSLALLLSCLFSSAHAHTRSLADSPLILHSFSDEGSLGFSMASGALRNVTSYDLVTGDPSIDNYDGRVMFIQFDTLNDRKVASSWNVSAAQFGLGGMEAWFGYSVAVMPDFDGELTPPTHAHMDTYTRTHAFPTHPAVTVAPHSTHPRRRRERGYCRHAVP